MNERIKELCLEVGINVDYVIKNGQWEIIEALVESVVLECAEIVSRNVESPEIIDEICERFGFV